MNAHTMVTMDTSENLHLLHICTEGEREVMDLMDIELVYGNSFFKSLATVGNVSEAMKKVKVEDEPPEEVPVQQEPEKEEVAEPKTPSSEKKKKKKKKKSAD
ncbi:Vacuolar protein sorting-associated protein 8-like [Holothuria leucospilota]|uniref:Vacuolar protein sorting-associated protein 8-like n=1 Tax=Holothuria leucospilota TaxID=206669 RepID=A0A9Q0Y8R1_HOLLE|nr:Vacuolar protein sorting-associated protein 8-like [Holothuria leucospilota]